MLSFTFGTKPADWVDSTQTNVFFGIDVVQRASNVIIEEK